MSYYKKSSHNQNKENDWPDNTVDSQKSSYNSKQSAEGIQAGCQYHPKKKPKYKIINIPFHCTRQKYQLCDMVCSKCAVSLVAMGYKVEETNQDMIQQRQEEIQLFLCQVQGCFQSLDFTETSLIDKREDLQKFCEKQRLRVKEYYQKIITTIEGRMNEQIYTLNEAQTHLSKMYDQKHQDLKEQHSDLLQMYSDIEVNLESIITTIDQLPYKQIMGQYMRRIQTVLQHISRLEQEQVCLVRVYLKRSDNQEMVMGGLLEDSELDVRTVQTGIIKRSQINKTNENTPNLKQYDPAVSRVLLSPTPSTGFTSQIAYVDGCSPTPQKSPNSHIQDNSLLLHKQRSLSQPTYGAQKYLDILQKVNENQLKTNDYYTSLMKHKKSDQGQMDYFDLSDNVSNYSQTLISVPISRASPVQQGKQFCSPKFK